MVVKLRERQKNIERFWNNYKFLQNLAENQDIKILKTI